MKPTTLALLLALAGVAATPALAQDAARGKARAQMCIGCHNIHGYQATFPEVHKVPMIAGQNAKYIVSALTAYAKGDRKHPTMRGIAVSLSEQDMADLGAFYEGLGKAAGSAAPPATVAEAPAALKDKMAACAACHGANFSTPIDPSYPKLAGQHADYLSVALRSYTLEGHANPYVGRSNASMRGQLVQEAEGQPRKLMFSPAELKAVGKYLASLPGELRTVPESRLR